MRLTAIATMARPSGIMRFDLFIPSEPFSSAAAKDAMRADQQDEYEDQVRDDLLQRSRRIDFGVGTKKCLEQGRQNAVGKCLQNSEQQTGYHGARQAGEATEHDHGKR